MTTKTLSYNAATPAIAPIAKYRSAVVEAVIARVARRERRARDYGVGYGSSSGYASGRHYAENWGNARFYCG